jgi:glycosyltransferase involved in cell wall biosynthesis
MRLYNQLDRWSLRTANRVMTSCASFATQLENKNVRPDLIRVQHMPVRPFNAVSPGRISALRAELGLEDHVKVLLSIGRLSHEKGHADLIREFPQIRRRNQDIPLRLVLVGEGPERAGIEALCRELNLSDAVTLVGQQDDVNPYYAIADLFVLPSHSEGSPNVLLEAMAARVPVVATAVGGIPEIVTHEREALLVRKQNGPDLADAVTRLLNDPLLRERLVRSGLEVVAAKTPEAYFRSIVSVFQDTLRTS